jgi:hypothetical protein
MRYGSAVGSGVSVREICCVGREEVVVVVAPTVRYGSAVGSGVNVGEVCCVGREEVVVIAVPTVDGPEVHADNAIIPMRRLNKIYFFIIENSPLQDALYGFRIIRP